MLLVSTRAFEALKCRIEADSLCHLRRVNLDDINFAAETYAEQEARQQLQKGIAIQDLTALITRLKHQLPKSRETSIATTHVETALLWLKD